MSGLFGVVSKTSCSADLFYGTDYLSHMGTEFGGLAVIKNPSDKNSRIIRKIHALNQGQFKSKFTDDYALLQGHYGIGVISDKDEQPIFLNTKFGPIAISVAGLLENNIELISLLHSKGISFSETMEGHSNATEIIGKLITQGETIVEGIQKVFSMIKGSASMIILAREGIYAVRDRFGYVPLIIGKKKDSFAVTNETNSFANLGYTIEKELEAGEITLLNDSGIQTLSVNGCGTSQICTFLWVYTGFPASSYYGSSAEKVRERCGALLAKRDTVKADFVSGVPDSGTAHAIGYAMQSGIPHRRTLVKYTPGYGRSYTPPTQELRDKVATMKLIAIADIIKGNNVVLCDDSIVRGTQLKNFTVQKLKECGAKDIHVRLACPPLLFPCRFCLSTRTTDELVARRVINDIEGRETATVDDYLDWRSAKYQKMVESIRKEIGVATLTYQRIDDMIEAVGIPKEKLCLYCWTGKHPVGAIDEVSSDTAYEALHVSSQS
jgi:amidophosphoribosyltransferase